jgi:hypothetical protein
VASAERNLDAYQANLRRMLALQDYERITAPFEGVITQRNADIGALVGPSGAASTAPILSPQQPSGGSADVGASNTAGSSGMANQAATPSTGQAQGGAIFAIAHFDKLRILVSVPESYASNIRNGMPAQVFLQERAGKPVAGTVTRAANSIDQNSRTMLTEVDIDNREGSLYPGMYAIVKFVQVRGESPLVVPGDAIVVRQDRTSVAVVRDQKIQMVPVEIGRDYGPSAEIASGLNEGDWVVTTVTDDVREGVKVRPRQNKSEGEDATGQGGAQTNQAPQSGPKQYGDQSVVNSESEKTNQQGKPGQGNKQQQQNGQKENNNQKPEKNKEKKSNDEKGSGR